MLNPLLAETEPQFPFAIRKLFVSAAGFLHCVGDLFVVNRLDSCPIVHAIAPLPLLAITVE